MLLIFKVKRKQTVKQATAELQKKETTIKLCNKHYHGRLQQGTNGHISSPGKKIHQNIR
jgi:hypothetical protein